MFNEKTKHRDAVISAVVVWTAYILLPPMTKGETVSFLLGMWFSFYIIINQEAALWQERRERRAQLSIVANRPAVQKRAEKRIDFKLRNGHWRITIPAQKVRDAE